MTSYKHIRERNDINFVVIANGKLVIVYKNSQNISFS